MRESAKIDAEERVLNCLVPLNTYETKKNNEDENPAERHERTREKMRKLLRAGELDNREIEIQTQAAPPVAGVFSMGGTEEMGMEMQDMLSKIMPGKQRTRRMRVKDALQLFLLEESEKRIDEEAVNREGVERASQVGIIFIDEVDKIIGPDQSHGPNVSREGVQRDLLPIVEGCSIATRWGVMKTDHVLFIAAGAFHGKKPSDLIPELQGRFPIRVELEALTEQDFLRILTQPRGALVKQYQLLLGADGVALTFTEDALKEMAKIAAEVNRSTQDIGARRLHTILEKVLEDVSFQTPDKIQGAVEITAENVRECLSGIAGNDDLSRFVL